MLENLQKIEFEIIIIIIGIGIFIYWSKRPETYPLVSVKYQGYMVGIVLILLGVISILNRFKVW